jgi:guanylate kinase
MGPSGSGKTTLGNFLKENGIPELVSHTTRAKRKGEIEGKTYYYVSKETFDKIDKIEYSKYGGNYYCLSKKEVEKKLDRYDKIFAIVDANGVKQVKNHFDNVLVIYIDVTLKEMEERMIKRGDNKEDIEKRLKHAVINNEFDNKKYADIIIKNDNLQLAKETLKNIVMINYHIQQELNIKIRK